MKKLFVIMLLSSTMFLYAQQKYALVIGNSNYTEFGTLSNPVNDADDMADALQKVGFTVDKLDNGNLHQMEAAVINLKNRLIAAGNNSYGFFYYAGHGVQLDGINYLIPVDANIPDRNFLRDRTISVQVIMETLNDAKNKLNIIVLDACRDFPAAWNRSATRGLAIVNPPADSIVVFATSAGSVASDGTGRNGLFTYHLLHNIGTPGIDVNEIFRRTGSDVSQASDRRQIPAVYSQFFDLAYFIPPAVQPPKAESTQQAQSPYWTGNGGTGTKVTVSELTGMGLSAQEMSLLYLTQGTLIGCFQKFSGMTVFDRQNLENILKEQRLSMTGNFSDTDYIHIGKLTNADLVVFGSITKATTGYTLELSVTDVKTGARRASCLPRQVSLTDLENQMVIREASADLLRQLGINLTERGLNELSRTENTERLQGESAMAMGIAAQRHGTTAEAFTYFFQAAAFDPSLMNEAVNRVSVLSADVSGGSLQNVQSRLQEHDDWHTIINNASTFYSNHLPYEFVYGTDIKHSSIDFEKRTTNLSIGISLIPTESWKAINDLRNGLAKARRDDVWNFSLSKIGPEQITATIQIISEDNLVLATASHTFGNLSETNRMDAVLTFPDVEADYVNDRIVVQVESINDIQAQSAAETGFIQITTLSSAETIDLKARLDREERKKTMQAPQYKRNDAEFMISEIWDGRTNLFCLDLGFYWSPIPLTFIGLEGFLGTTTNKTGPKYRIYTISPVAGFIFPFNQSVAIYMNPLIEMGQFDPWNGLLTDWMAPGFDAGFRFNIPALNQPFHVSLKYRGLFLKNIYANSVSLGLAGSYR